MEWTHEIQQALAAAFPEDEIEYLPRTPSNGKARAAAYIDARSVMRRLDAVVGVGNWSFDFEVLAPEGKMVKGKLTVLGVCKCDAGESDAEGEALKSAVSDALKRCAVHFGIGRYLYYLPAVWAPFDPQKRHFTETPRHNRAVFEKALAMCGVTSSAPLGGTAYLREPVVGNLSVRDEPAPPRRAAASVTRNASPATEDGAAKRSIWNGSGAPQNGSAPTPGRRQAAVPPDRAAIVAENGAGPAVAV